MLLKSEKVRITISTVICINICKHAHSDNDKFRLISLSSIELSCQQAKSV